MIDFLSKLFDTTDFPPRWHCGNWTAAHGWLHIVSDLGIWSAYIAIPCVLAYFLLRRRDIPFRGIFILFGAFIFACGTTHLMEALVFWWPAYRLAGVIKLFTAIVSWGTVAALVPVVPRALAFRSPEEMERQTSAQGGGALADSGQRRVGAASRRAAPVKSGSVCWSREPGITPSSCWIRPGTLFPGIPEPNVSSNTAPMRSSASTFHVFIRAKISRPRSRSALQIALAEGRYEQEGWRLRKDGSRFWASIVITALRDDAGKVRGFSKVTRDVTDKMQAEEHARRLIQEEAARAPRNR